MKKLIALLLALVMVLGLVACGGTSSSSNSGSSNSGTTSTPAGNTDTTPSGDNGSTENSYLSADGRYPAETIKLGFETFTTTDEQFLAIKAYLEYLQQFFNIEIIYSEALDSAEGELAFIEQCAAAGCKGIIAYYNVTNEEAVKLCAEKGMYYWGNANNTAIVEYGNTTEYYVGGHYIEDSDYQFGYGCVQALAQAGCKKIILVSGGASFGVEMFIDRKAGAEAAAADLGVEIVYEVPGWPGTEDFSAHQTNALATDADGIASMLTALMWINPLQNAGKFGTVKVAAVDALNETVVSMFGAGMYVGCAAEITDVFGMSVPMLLNAIMGHASEQRNADGSAWQVDADWWLVTSVEDAGYYASAQGGDNGWAAEGEDLLNLIYDLNPDVTIDDFQALYTAMEAAEIQARKAG